MSFEAPEIPVFAGEEEKQGLIVPYISFQQRGVITSLMNVNL